MLCVFFNFKKVLSQFRDMYERRCNMEEVYVMGHRLIVFLDEALPQHPEYNSSKRDFVFLREKSRVELDWIQNRLDVVALRVDEGQLNQFILNGLRGYKNHSQNEVDDKMASPPQLRQRLPESQWESFSGWATLSNTNDEVQWEAAHDVSFESSDLDDSCDETEIETYESDFPDRESDYARVSVEIPDEADYSFLHRIAEEEVVYDSDSEAVDSWDPSSDDVGSPSPRLKHRKALEDMANKIWKRPREDPPGISFSEMNCFTTMTRRQSYQDDNAVHRHNNMQTEANSADGEGIRPPSQVQFDYSEDESDDDQTLVSMPREARGAFSMD
jgi:hypothetical protein